jgi:hypothetical protein
MASSLHEFRILGLHPIVPSVEELDEALRIQWGSGLAGSELERARESVKAHFSGLFLIEIQIKPADAEIDWFEIPQLRKYVQQPQQVEEVIDNDAPRYSVKCGGREFHIYAPEFEDQRGSNSWGRATCAFFVIVNDQLANSAYRLNAINGGNDLGGIFLTPEQANAARKGLARKQDWPYLPKDEPPWYGQYH